MTGARASCTTCAPTRTSGATCGATLTTPGCGPIWWRICATTCRGHVLSRCGWRRQPERGPALRTARAGTSPGPRSREHAREELLHVLPRAPVGLGVVAERDAVGFPVRVGIGIGEAVQRVRVGDEAVVGPRLVHLLLEGVDTGSGHHAVGRAVTDEDLRPHAARRRLVEGVQRAMEADDAAQR